MNTAIQTSINVLCVSDDPETTDRIQRGFDRGPYTFDMTAVTSADEGLSLLTDANIDCIVSEFDLPDMDGLDFLEAARDILPDIPFILLTDEYNESVAHAAVSAGVTDYRRKGLESEQYQLLATRIADAVDHQRSGLDYREIFEKIPDGMALHDSNGAILDANHQFAEMLGYSREELLEIDFDALHIDEPPYTSDRAEQLIGKAAAEGPQTFEWVVKTKDGKPLPVEVNLRLTRIGGKERILAVVRDITERKERERQLQQRSTAMEGSMDGMAIVDEEGDYTYVNQAHVEAYGYDDPEAFLGESWRMCYTDDMVAEFEEQIFSALETEGQWRGEATGKRRDGSSFPQELTLTTLDEGGLICIVRDISDRREQEQELERKTDLLEKTQRMATVGGWEFDPRTDNLYLTDEIHRIYELPLDYEPELESVLEFFHPEDTHRIEDAIERAIEDGESYDVELRLVTAKDNLRWTRALGEPLQEDGETIMLRGAFQDITERKQYENRLKALNETSRELTTAETEEAIAKTVVDTAYHLLDQPLTAMRSYDADEDVLVPLAVADPAMKFSEAWNSIDGMPTFPAGTAEMEIFRTGEPTVIENYQEVENPAYPESPLGTLLVMPLGDHGQLHIGSPVVEDLDPAERQLAEILVRHTRAALDRVEHEDALQRQTDQMEFFNSILRHDVLNGMTVIRSRAEFLTDDLEGDQLRDAETVLNWSNDVIETVQRVQATLDTLTGQTDIPLESVELSETLREELDRVRETYPEVAFDTTIPDSVTVQANELLGEVLGNIVTNAVNHNNTEGLRISITASEEQEGNTMNVRIADNGKGVPDEAKETIFRRDETGHAKSSGSGFGLFFVDSMVDQYGGNVWVEDNERGGATFVIELPLAEATAQA